MVDGDSIIRLEENIEPFKVLVKLLIKDHHIIVCIISK